MIFKLKLSSRVAYWVGVIFFVVSFFLFLNFKQKSHMYILRCQLMTMISISMSVVFVCWFICHCPGGT